MTTRARRTSAELRAKYARVYALPIESVAEEADLTVFDGYVVWCPSRPELPKWSTGEMRELPDGWDAKRGGRKPT